MRGIANLASRVCVPEIIHRWPGQVNQEIAVSQKVNLARMGRNGPFGPNSGGICRVDRVGSNQGAEFLDLFVSQISKP